MRKAILLAAVFLTVLPEATFAQSGSPADRRACNGDARRFCGRVIKQGEMAVYSCLQQNATRLTRRCRRVVMGY